MNLDRVTSGQDVPHDVDVVIRIPAHADPVKYEADKDAGALFVDRFLNTAMHCSCNDGYAPHTLSEDGDPVDVLVVTPIPLISGSAIRCRPVGMLWVSDEKGLDAKVLAVPIDRLCTLYRGVQKVDDLPPMLAAQIAHFFEPSKDLEAGKRMKVEGWADASAAQAEFRDGVDRCRRAKTKPYF